MFLAGSIGFFYPEDVKKICVERRSGKCKIRLYISPIALWDTSGYPELSYYEKYALKFTIGDLDKKIKHWKNRRK